jgi:hypothetical protein
MNHEIYKGDFSEYCSDDSCCISVIYGKHLHKLKCLCSVLRNVTIGVLGAETRNIDFSKPALSVRLMVLFFGTQQLKQIDFVTKVMLMCLP